MARFGLWHDSLLSYPSSNESRFGQTFSHRQGSYKFRTNPFLCNEVSAAVRGLFQLLRLDQERFGLRDWNPLGEYITPGDKVLIKPNLVVHFNASGGGTECLYTHPSLIACVIHYVSIALNGDGKIILADAPMQSCDFDRLTEESGIKDIVDWYHGEGVDITLLDFRDLRSSYIDGALQQEIVNSSNGRMIELGSSSSFSSLPQAQMESLRITNYDPMELRRHHNVNQHEYCIAKEALEADVIINMPKGKTHRKAGITGALKNMVGINARKECLPHHMQGARDDGFDEYRKASLFRSAASSLLDLRNSTIQNGGHFRWKTLSISSGLLGRMGKVLSGDWSSEGGWYGNDTIWRTVDDLNKIIFYADKEGVLRPSKQRAMLCIGDLIVAGEGNGPLSPEPICCGAITFCDNPVSHDVAMCRLFGVDVECIPTVRNLLQPRIKYSLIDEAPNQIKCCSNDPAYDGVPLTELTSICGRTVKSPEGWSEAFATT